MCETPRNRIIVGVVILVLAAGAYWCYGRYYAGRATDLLASGTIEATTVNLNVKVAGTLGTLSVKAGDSVNAGQLVARIIRNDLVAQRERDALTVLKAENQLNDLLAGSRSQELQEATAGVNTARATYDKALADLSRCQALYENEAASESDLEKARTAAEVAQNQLASAEARLSLLQEGARPEQIEAARNEVNRCRAVLKASNATLDDLKIYSPISGVLLVKNYEPGEYVQAGASLGTVADLSRLWVKVYIPTTDLPYVKLGQPVNVTVSGLNLTFPGTVEEIATRGEFTPKTIQTQQERANVVFGVKVRVNDNSRALKPGMPADVSFGPRLAQ